MRTFSHSKKNCIDALVGTMLLLLGIILPGIGVVSKQGMLVIGAFISIIYGWARNLSGWYAVLITLIYSVAAGADYTNSIITSLMGSSSVWMILFALWFAAVLQNSGLMNYLTAKLLSLKIAKKGPYWLMCILMVTTLIVNAVTQVSLAVLVLILAMLQSITEELGLEKYNIWTVITAVGCALCNSLGSVLFPFAATQVFYFTLIKSTFGVQLMPPFGAYFIHMLVLCILSIAVIILITKYIIRPKVDFSSLDNLKALSGEEVKFTKAMGWSIVATLVVVFILMLPSMLPSSWAITGVLSRFGSVGAFAIAVLIGVFVQGEDGNALFNFEDRAQRTTPWTLLLTVGAMFYFGGMLNVPETGIPQLFNLIAQPLSGLSPMVVVCLLTICIGIATNFLNNWIVQVMFAPIGFALLGHDTAWTMMLVTMSIASSSIALALPSASSSAIALHANKEVGKSSQYITWGFIFAVIITLVCALTGVLLKGLYF